MPDQSTCAELKIKIKELEKEASVRIEAMVSLEEKLERYYNLVENASDLIHSVSPQGTFFYVNTAWKETLGYSDDEIKKISLMDIVDESCRNKCRCIFNSLIQGEILDRNETIFVAKDGRRIVVEGRCSTQFQDGRPVSMTGIFRDITDRTASEKALRESEKRYRALFENAHDLIQMIRPDGKLLYVNRSWRKTFGYNEEDINDGLTIFDLISPDCQQHCVETFQRIITEEKVHYINATFVAKDGREIIIEGNATCKFEDGNPISTQCIFQDVTEKKKMEEELFKAQKLESVGIFAGGIAHDFNNLLTGIMGNISLSKMYVKPGDKAFARLAATEKACMRASELTQQLLTFAKGGAPVKTTATIRELIMDSTSFALRGSNVKSDYDIDPDLWTIEVDKGQLSQVTQNLVINACQAMTNGGTVTIKARNIKIGEYDVLTLPPGKYVQISVIDQGHGVPKENLNKIFDPYFSSKQQGSGLGLAIAYSIIKNHDGLIIVDSEEGKGSTFSIYLPALPDTDINPNEEKEEISACSGKVLIMDDEEIVREVAMEMLSSLGCEAEVACDGQQAIDLYKKAITDLKPFDAVIMDLTIPGGMGGKEAITKLLEIDPKIKAIVSSGYAHDPIMANFKQYGFSGVVPKPYKAHQLGKVLSSVLRLE
ncbi:MAG: PAS domain S-box protein [Desulfobulbaceae bacterium]|nr:PAS domain S-box protein [Desulfobulbaceae bacterium]